MFFSRVLLFCLILRHPLKLMHWYYADNGQQAGPVSDAELDTLIQNGKVTPETLIWHEGMADWRPCAQARMADSPPGNRLCAECGRPFPKDDLIRLEEHWICADCKPIFLQKLKEGVATGFTRGRRSLPVNADTLLEEVMSKGIQVNAGSCISRSWNLWKKNWRLVVGATFLVLLCNRLAGFLPVIGVLLSLLLQGPLMGGLYVLYLKLIRGEQANVGDAFGGLSKGFWRLCGTFILCSIIIGCPFLPFGFYCGFKSGQPDLVTKPLFWILLLPAFTGMVYFGVGFLFSLFLSADLELKPMDALRVSRRVTSSKWFSFFGLAVLGGLVASIGLFACFVGIFFTLPILYGALAYAYEDIFGVPSSEE